HEGAPSEGPHGSTGGRGDGRVRLSSGGAAGANQRGPLETRPHRRPHSETLQGEISGAGDAQRAGEETTRRLFRIRSGAAGRARAQSRTARGARSAEEDSPRRSSRSRRYPRRAAGASLQPGQRVTAGTTIARVVQPDKLKAQLKIAETQARDVQIGES